MGDVPRDPVAQANVALAHGGKVESQRTWRAVEPLARLLLAETEERREFVRLVLREVAAAARADDDPAAADRFEKGSVRLDQLKSNPRHRDL